MEPHRSIASRTQRKPLGDCTNTISSHPSSSSSSVVKFANPSLTSSLRRLIDQTSLKEKKKKSQDVINSSNAVAERTTGTVRPVTRRESADLGSPAEPSPPPPSKHDGVDTPEAGAAPRLRPVTRRMSADLGFPASAPPQPRSGVGDKEATEPYSVYTVRRKASGRKKSKDVSSSSAMPRLRFDLISSPGKRKLQADENKTSVASKKRQRTVKKQQEDKVDREYIEKQKAYFAEVDAFELQEEEVSSSDLD